MSSPASSPQLREEIEFTEDELEYLLSTVTHWKSIPAAKRRSYVDGVLRHFMDSGREIDEQSLEKEVKQAIAAWYADHVKGLRKEKPVTLWGRKWSAQKVWYLEKGKKEIEEKRVDDGSIGNFQKVAWGTFNALPAAERQMYQKRAEEWNNNGAPLELQKTIADQEVYKYTRTFASFMYKRFGARYFFLTSYQNQTNHAVIEGLDFNDKLGDAYGFKQAHSEWKRNALKEFKQYSDDIFATESRVAGPKKKQHLFNLDYDGGWPCLPQYRGNDIDARLTDLKDLLRLFITEHYHLACGNRKTRPPWAEMALHPEAFMSLELIPATVTLREPSKMLQSEVVACLQHWFGLQSGAREHQFQFIGWYDTQTKMMYNAIYDLNPADDNSKHTGVSKRKRRSNVKKGRPVKKSRKGKERAHTPDEEEEVAESTDEDQGSDRISWAPSVDGDSEDMVDFLVELESRAEEEYVDPETAKELLAMVESEITGWPQNDRDEEIGGTSDEDNVDEHSEFDYGSENESDSDADLYGFHIDPLYPEDSRYNSDETFASPEHTPDLHADPMSPAAAKWSESGRISFLKSLTSDDQYHRVVELLYLTFPWQKLEAPAMKPEEAWTSWTYSGTAVPERIHSQRDGLDEFMAHARRSPRVNSSPYTIDVPLRWYERWVIPLGLIWRDIDLLTGTTNPPHPKDTNYLPPYLWNSKLRMDTVTTFLHEICAALFDRLSNPVHPNYRKITKRFIGSKGKGLSQEPEPDQEDWSPTAGGSHIQAEFTGMTEPATTADILDGQGQGEASGVIELPTDMAVADGRGLVPDRRVNVDPHQEFDNPHGVEAAMVPALVAHNGGGSGAKTRTVPPRGAPAMAHPTTVPSPTSSHTRGRDDDAPPTMSAATKDGGLGGNSRTMPLRHTIQPRARLEPPLATDTVAKKRTMQPRRAAQPRTELAPQMINSTAIPSPITSETPAGVEDDAGTAPAAARDTKRRTVPPRRATHSSSSSKLVPPSLNPTTIPSQHAADPNKQPIGDDVEPHRAPGNVSTPAARKRRPDPTPSLATSRSKREPHPSARMRRIETEGASLRRPKTNAPLNAITEEDVLPTLPPSQTQRAVATQSKGGNGKPATQARKTRSRK